MIDTISTKFRISPSPKQLTDWVRKPTVIRGDLVKDQYIHNAVIQNGSTVKCKFIPIDKSGSPLLIVEFSLPKVIYGDNVQLVTNLEEGVECANEKISQISLLPEINLWQGVLGRIDFCHNYQLGEDVGEYIDVISELNLSRRVRKCYQTSVYFESEKRRVVSKFYDKFAECGLPTARGILRQEISLIGTNRIEPKLGKKQPTLRDIDPKKIKEILEEDLYNLGLDKCQVIRRDDNMDICIKEFDKGKSLLMYGFLNFLLTNQGKDRKWLAENLGVDISTISRYYSDLKKKGIAPAFSISCRTLPPLEINYL